MKNIVVLGGGSWGTALAHVLAQAGHEPLLLARDESVVAAVNERHENPRYLPGLALHHSLRAAADFTQAAGADILVLAVPSQQQRRVLSALAPRLRPDVVLINAAKGIELESLLPLSRVIHESTGRGGAHYAVLSGPSFAAEVLEGKPTAVVLACEDKLLGEELRAVFSTDYFRTYSSRDVRGVELGGAVKNVIAIAAGVSDGLGFGHNARAALVTRGLAEITRLGVEMGARASTFMGLSGLGDLMLTCAGDLSRNRQVGLRLGRGEALPDIIASMRNVAEGVKTTEAVHSLAEKLGVDMPVTRVMHALLQGTIQAREAVQELMSRALKDE